MGKLNMSFATFSVLCALTAANVGTTTVVVPNADGMRLRGSHGHGLRASQGRGRDTQCILPPPPLQNQNLSAAAASATMASGAIAPPHLKYLGLDGSVGDDAPWSNLGFMAPDNHWNLTTLKRQKASGVVCQSQLINSTRVRRIAQ